MERKVSTDQLQAKIKTYKKQIEEAEEIASLNLAKFRQVQTVMVESLGNAENAEPSCQDMCTQLHHCPAVKRKIIDHLPKVGIYFAQQY